MSNATIAQACAWVVSGANAAAGLYAAALWWRVAPTRGAWRFVRGAQALAIAQAVVAGVLAATGFDPDAKLFWLYALLPVPIGLIAEQLRIVSAEQVLENRGLQDAQEMRALPEAEQQSVVLAIMRRELGVVALAAIVVAFLALRAALVV